MQEAWGSDDPRAALERRLSRPGSWTLHGLQSLNTGVYCDNQPTSHSSKHPQVGGHPSLRTTVLATHAVPRSPRVKEQLNDQTRALDARLTTRTMEHVGRAASFPHLEGRAVYNTLSFVLFPPRVAPQIHTGYRQRAQKLRESSKTTS